MTRGFDDLTLTFNETKLCDHDKENWCQYPQAYESVDTENKFLNPIWMYSQNNPIFGCRVKISPDINPIYCLMDLSWHLQKGMTIVCRSYVIGHNFINHIYECEVK